MALTINRVDGPGVSARLVTTAKRTALPASTFDDSIAQGVVEGGTAIIGALTQVKKERDEADAENAILDYQTQASDLFNNKDTGYFNIEGKPAYDEADPTSKKLAEIQRKAGESLAKSPEAFDMYQRVSKSHMLRGNEQINQHAAKENRKYRVATKDAIVSHSLEQASVFYADDMSVVNAEGKSVPSEFTKALIAGEDAITAKFEMQGLEGVALDEALDDFQSAMYASKIKGALDAKNVTQAVADMGRFGQHIDPPMRAELQRVMDIRVDEQYVEDLVTEVRTSGKTDKEQLAQIREENDPKRKKEAERRWANVKAQDDNLETAELTEAYNDYYLKMTEGGFKVSDIPVDDRDDMTAGQINALLIMEDRIAKGDDVVTNARVYGEIRLLSDEDFAKLTVDDIVVLSEDLSTTDMKRLLDSVAAMKRALVARDLAAAKASDKTKDEHTASRTKTQIMSGTLKSILGRKPKKKDDEFVNEFARLFSLELNDAEIEKGKSKGKDSLKLTPLEYEELINKFTGKLNIEDGGFMFFDKEFDLADVPAARLVPYREAIVNFNSAAKLISEKRGGTYTPLPINSNTLIALDRAMEDSAVSAQVRNWLIKHNRPVDNATMIRTYLLMDKAGLIDG